MTSYLKSHMVWRIVTREAIALVQKEGETKEKYDEWTKDWDGKNVDIIT